jgi:hypothetical protein
VYEKDRKSNKDLNTLALEELKMSHYYFEYLRTSEKLYDIEKTKKAKQAVEETQIPES